MSLPCSFVATLLPLRGGLWIWRVWLFLTLAAYAAAGQIYRGMPETEAIGLLGEPRTEILRGGATVRTFSPDVSIEFRGARVHTAVGIRLQKNDPNGRFFHLNEATGIWMVDGEQAPAVSKYVVDRAEPGRLLRTAEGRLILAQEPRTGDPPEIEAPPSYEPETPEPTLPPHDPHFEASRPTAEDHGSAREVNPGDGRMPDDGEWEDGEWEDDPYGAGLTDEGGEDYDDWFAHWEEPEPLPVEVELALAVVVEFLLSMIVARIAFGLFAFPVLWRQLALLGLAMALTTLSLNGLIFWLEISFVPPLLPELVEFFIMAFFIYLFTDVTQGVTALQISLLCRIVITLLNYSFVMALLLYIGSFL